MNDSFGRNVAKVLPPDARDALQRAARIEPHLGPGESMNRTRALNQVTQRIRLKYPQFFK